MLRLQAIGLCKSYGPTRALHNVEIALAPGEIHALLGENGAGKSTLVKILGAEEMPDAGMIFLDEWLYTPAEPLDARRAGVSVVDQETKLAGDLTVEENLVLGLEPARRGVVKRSERRAMARSALAEIHADDIPLRAPVATLPVGDRQRVEIARAFLGNPKLLILDEPTRSLSHWETGALFEALRRLSARGIAILFISHFLEESQALCSHYTVLRDGSLVASGGMASMDRAGLLRLMNGCEVREDYERLPRHRGKPLLQLKRLSGMRSPRQIDITLHEGEVIGLAGLDGAGRSATLRTVFGLEPLRSGQIWRDGKRLRWGTPVRRMHAGISMMSKEREEGFFPDLSIADSLTLTCMRRFGWFGFFSDDRQYFSTRDWMEKLRIRAHSPLQPSSTLSGGNQRKLTLGRLLMRHDPVLLLDEPTRGIDVATKTHIYEIIDTMAYQGHGILLASSDPAELLKLCDHIAMLRHGRLVEMRPACEWTEPEIIAVALGPP